MEVCSFFKKKCSYIAVSACFLTQNDGGLSYLILVDKMVLETAKLVLKEHEAK